MNINRKYLDDIDKKYQYIFKYNSSNVFKPPLQNMKSPINKNNLKNNNYFSFNKQPETNYIQDNNYYIPTSNYIRKSDSEDINLDENININDYLRENENRKKAIEKSPSNYKRILQNTNYYNYNKNFNNNNNSILRQNESDNYESNNNIYQYSDDDMNRDWKKKILQINNQKTNYEYFNRNRENYDYKNNNNYSYNERKNNYDDKKSILSQSDYSNQILSQSMNMNIFQPKKYINSNYSSDNYTNFDNNKLSNINNNYNQKYSQDFNLGNFDLSDNSINNYSQQNYYKNYNNFNNFISNNDSSSSNFYDESFEKNKTQNYTNQLKSKFSDISKMFNSMKSVSISSQDSSELYRDKDSFNTAQFKMPVKNDENHYLQNLTIKLAKKDENNKNKYFNFHGKTRQPKYVDNTPEGCNVSTITDYNDFKDKKISNFKIKHNDKNLNHNNLSMNSDNTKSLNNNKTLNSSTMIILQKMQKNLENNNNNSNINKNKESSKINSKKIKLKKINNKYYIPHKENNKQFKGRSPQNFSNNNFNKMYINTLSSKNINSKTPLKNIFSRSGMNNNNQTKNELFQNISKDNIYEKIKIKKDKKIKEITVDLSPRRKLYNLSNSNENLNKINNITPNYNYSQSNNNKYDLDNFNNININPNPKIESCIITFDKNKKNKKFKLSSSLDGIKFSKIKKYVKKKIQNNNAYTNNINNNFYETPKMNNNINNKIKFIDNKNKSSKKIYIKPGKRELSSSLGKSLQKEDNKNEEVQDYCAPSPDYGKREKNIEENLLSSDIYNNSSLLVSGNFNDINNDKKEQIKSTPSNYDEFSFKEKLNANKVNDDNYDYSKPIKVKIINNSNYNSINNDNNIKNVYMKKSRNNNKLNINNNSGFNLINSQRIPTFSNIDPMIKNENNENINKNNKKNQKKKLSCVTPFGSSEPSKNEKIKKKLIIKSFNKKKIEIKNRPKLKYSFFRKYYKLHMIQQTQTKKQFRYFSKNNLKPTKKPIIPISFITKNKFKYIYKIPVSSYDYYTKKIIPNILILPKIDIGYMTKVLIKNKEYIENKLNNIGNDKFIDDKYNQSSNQKNKTKKRIILIKTKKLNKKYKNKNNDQIENKNINNINIVNNSNNEDSLSFKKEEITNILNRKEETKNNIRIFNYSSKDDKDKNIKNNKMNFIKKQILHNNFKKEKGKCLLEDNNKFDNEKNISPENNISINLNINELNNKKDNDSRDNSKIFKFNKSISNSSIKTISNNTSINETLNKTSSNFNIVKSSILNFGLNNNLNKSNNSELSMFSNNTINIELDKKHSIKNFKIRTIKRGVKKKSKNNFLKNYKKNKNINISELMKSTERTQKDIARDKKVDLIIKEDLENFLIFYKDNLQNNDNNKKQKYDWSMVEQLMIKIKLDIVDIINSYLKACNEVVDSKRSIIIVNEYIKNIIHHYKYNYLNNINYDIIHNKILKLFLSIKDIKIYDSIKFEIYGKLLLTLYSNELFFINDLNVIKQADKQTVTNFIKIINNSDNISLINNFTN